MPVHSKASAAVDLSQSAFSGTSSPDLSSTAISRENSPALSAGSRRSFMGRVVDTVGNKLAIATTMMGMGFGAMSEKAEGATILNAAARPASEALGAAQDEVVWLEGSFGGQTYHASGILFRGASADWVLVAAHAVTGPGGTVDIANLTLGNGTSYLNDRGQTSGVSNWIISPEARASATSGSKPYGDIVYLELGTRLSGPGYYNLSVTTSSPGFNQNLLLTGFGEPVSLSEGALPITGNVMGFSSLFSTAEPANWNTDLYDAALFQGSATGLGSQGDSGGSVKVWNDLTGSYDLAGMIIGGNTAGTVFYNFNEPSFNDIMNNTIQPGSIPEPSVGVLSLIGLVAAATMRRRRTKT